MPTVGEQLRSAREARTLDIYQVAEVTKIRTDHLRALEAGDYNLFAAPVYIRGFTRTYAGLLKLDVPKIMSDLNQELAQIEKFQTTPAHGSARGPLDVLVLGLARLNWRQLGIAGAILVLVILGLVAFGPRKKPSATNPLIQLGPGLYQSKPGGELLPLPTNAPQR